MRAQRVILLIIGILSYTVAGAQKVALKNNLLLDGMASPNLGVEFKVGEKTTINIPASLNLWSFSDTKKLKHIATQPEVRRWLCQPFNGAFWGLHAHYAFYNVGGIGPFTTIKNNRYEGWLAGVGINYGYNWILAPRWSLEITAGVGYTYLSHDKYPCGKCQPLIQNGTKHYFGPTKLGITFVFLLK